MKSYKELGNKYIKHRKKRAVLVTLSMVLTTILIYIVTTIAVNFYTNYSNQVKEQYNFEAQIMSANKEQREKIKNHVSVESVDFARFEEARWFKEFHGGENVPIYFMESFDQDTFNIKLVEGSLPTSSQEILIYEGHLHLFHDDIKVGSYVTTEICDMSDWSVIGEETFLVTGIYNYDTGELVATPKASFSLGSDDMDMVAYVRFNNSDEWETSIRQVAKDVGIDTGRAGAYYVNDLMETISFKGEAMVMVVMVLMVMVFVVYITMTMIRSLFTSNLNDNISEFSILKAMGATDKKIRDIFKREAYIEGIIAFVIGIAISQVIFFILGKVIKLYGVDFSFNIVAVLFALFVLFVTISLAVVEPFNILKRVPIVEGIKANYAINNRKEKKRGGKLFRIFGVEGEYAYKNIRRNSKSFMNGVASFAISTLLLVSMVTVMANLEGIIEVDSGGVADDYDYYTLMDASDADSARIKEIENYFLGTGFVDEADPHYAYIYILEEGDVLLPYSQEASNPSVKSSFAIGGDMTYVELYTKEQLELLNSYMLNGVDATTIMSGGAIIMGNCTYYDEATGETKNVKVVDAEVGDEIKVLSPKSALDMVDAASLEQRKLTDEGAELIEIKGFCTNGIGTDNYTIKVIMSYEYVTEQTGLDLSSLCDGFYLKTSDDYTIVDEIELSRVIFGQAKQIEYDYFNEMRWMNEQMKSYKIVLYGIVAFILLMGIVSILNNMVNEQQVRRKEVSILRAIGMSKKKLNKMLVLEKIIMGLIAWIIGVVLGLVLTRVIFIAILYMYETTFVVPWLAYLLIGVGVTGVMVLISMFMVVSMGKMDITEGVRNQE